MKAAYHPGRRFGRLVMIERTVRESREGGQRRSYARVRCDCGTVFVTRIGHLVDGQTRSCGCAASAQATTSPERRLYYVWGAMRRRCAQRQSYIDRGIGYDPRWHSFALFVRDVAKDYVPGHHLHRTNSMGHYGPLNTTWLAPRDHFAIHRKQQEAA